MGVVVISTRLAAEDRAIDRAFHHYEIIRQGLASDTMQDVTGAARALAPLAGEIAGDAARRAAASLAEAQDLKAAREHFGALSDALVPKFLEAHVAGATGFVCPMNQKRWAQKGSKPDNPYYGKAMATCGTALKPGRPAGGV
jgi:hypothetical protein